MHLKGNAYLAMEMFLMINTDRKGNTDIGFIYMNYHTLEIPKEF